MKPTHKKVIGGLLVGLLIATIGAAFATAQDNNTTNDTTPDIIPQMPFEGRDRMIGVGPLGSELTDEQQTELEMLMTSLREQNATPFEVRTALQEKLDEFGVFDTRLDTEIAQTQQRLNILTRQKELRDEGYSWDEINSIIEDEFGLENVTDFGWNMRGGHGFGHRPERCHQEFIPFEDSDQ